MEDQPNYYLNPAFCQQSEFHPPRALSPQGSIRQSPVGAQTIPRILDHSMNENVKHPEEEGLQEQEFYEEVVVDSKGFITDKKFVVVAQNNEGKKYIRVPEEERHASAYRVPPHTETTRYGSRYGSTQNVEYTRGSKYDVIRPARTKENKLVRSQSQRYEYIQMQEHDSRLSSPKTSPQKTVYQEERVELPQARVHQYALIDAKKETEVTTPNARYALVPVDQLNNVIAPQSKNRYEYIQEPPQSPSRYEYIQTSPQNTPSRYDYIHQLPRTGNPVATQKLYELLSTPKKSPSRRQVLSPPSGRKVLSPQPSPIPKESFQSRALVRAQPNKAQQKLNYALGTRQLVPDKRHTAIVAPICSSPIQSVYSETTYSVKSESWMNLSIKKTTIQATLTVAALMMLSCGGVTSALCFYMISIMGRHYFLDFGIIAGFTCLVLGMLGFRTKNVYWLPNRNYISGYLVLSVFSLLTCAGLLALLVMQPRPGTPLADMTSGAVCGISVLILLLSMAGVVSSYCCKYPPPDNRVQHSAAGFTV